MTALVQLLMWIRSKTMCQIVIDATGPSISKQIDCRVRDGRLIVLARENVRVEVKDLPLAVDLTEVVKAALGGDAASIQSAAEAVGGNVSVDPR